MNNIKQKIISKSIEIGIDLIGFCDNNFDELLPILKKQSELGYKSNLQKTDINNYNPKNLLSNVNTIISIGISYSSNKNLIKNLKDDEVYFCSSSIGLDYHIVLKEKIEKLCNYIKTLVPNLEYKICIDTSIIDDRFVAYKSGIGFYGKNGMIINPQYGSYIYLGTILTNMNLDKDKNIKNTCLNCNKCIDVCPNKAINETGLLDYKKCLSYITQKKDELTLEEEKNMNQCIFGCDLCQLVCPYNKIDYKRHNEFEPLGIEVINIQKYKLLSNKEFKKKYGLLSGAFRGKKIIDRNISIYKRKLDEK